MLVLKLRAIPGVEFVSDSVYARTIELEEYQGVVAIRPTSQHALEVTIRFPKLSALPVIISRLRRVFDLSADPSAINAHLRHDLELAPLVKSRPGLRVPGAWDGFELAVRALLGQQITVPAATRLAGKLAAEHGVRLRQPDAEFDELTHVFPTPQRIAGADLSGFGMPRRRLEALSSLASAVCSDPMIFGAHRSLEEAVLQLRRLPGIGEWTAQYIAMRELREPDAFPAADIGLMRAMTDLEGVRPSAQDLLARAELWRPWRAYAAQHLWAKAASTPTIRALAKAVPIIACPL